MKTNKLHILFLSFMAVLSGWFVDETDFPTSLSFSVCVSDRGYAPTPSDDIASDTGDTSTRTADEGYITHFTVGDRIGVVGVMAGNIMRPLHNRLVYFHNTNSC